MPSSSTILVLCFFSFILGQLFNALCASLSTSSLVTNESTIRLVSSGPSFSLLIIVVSVLAVHDILIILVLPHLLSESKPIAKSRRRKVLTYSKTPFIWPWCCSFLHEPTSHPQFVPSSDEVAGLLHSKVIQDRLVHACIRLPCPTSYCCSSSRALHRLGRLYRRGSVTVLASRRA
ncbi:hypothetical protein B0H17DRAFT_573661 [Mycena rosella]|uniref:Uncharacterized protein n=1 Tax=Mycena rosella TaxID=1033263 RepID=A0AAD7GX20_MYCRO|nr:hypothetical protein B0H17DRAFT_573661 [Mycena rosella]